MKRKFLALLCIVAMVLSLASCDVINKILGNDEPQDETCEHTYSDKWSTNSTEHWHAATCEHAELKSDVAAHTDADEDGKCDVCDLEIGHEHTYADTWTSNDTHHWKVATCSHTDQKGELAAHVDLDSNGECDVCSSHVHVLDIYGDCTVCGEHVTDVDITDINVILPIVLSNTGKVNGGTITAGSIITDLELVGDEIVSYPSGNAQEIVYVLGNGSAYYKVDTVSFYGDSQYTGTQETWYELLADGSVFGVYQSTYDGETSDFEVDGTASADSLVGFYYPVSTLVDAYGAENLLAALFALAQSDAASDYQYGYDEGTYAFIFNYLAVNSDTGEGEGDHVDYYEVMVYFNVSENGVLTDLGVVCSCYTNSLEDELDNDYTYDQNAGTITMKDTAVADIYTFVITQTEGERTYVSEHSKSDFFPESFDAFVDADLTTQLGETVTVTEGNTLTVYFGNFIPDTTSAKYIMDTFTATVDEENVSYWAYDGTASFISNVPGTYPVVFTLGNETFSFTLVVEAYVPDEVEYAENSVVVEITGANTYEWSAVGSFTAPEDGDYTFTVPAGFGAWDKIACDNNFSGNPYVDLYDEDGGEFTVSIKAGETYEFYVTSTTRGIAVITYTVSEYTGSDDDDDDNGGVATEVVAGTYYGINGYNECTLVINTDNSTVTMNGYEYPYTFADGVMTLYLNGNPMAAFMLGVTLGSDGTPVSFVYNGNTYEVYSGEIDDGDDEPAESGLVIGQNTIVATEEDYANEAIRYTFVVTAEGTYTFSSSNLMAVVYDEHGMQIGRGSVYLTEGVYDVDIVLAYAPGAGTYTVTIEYTAPAGEGEGDGSEGNPFELPEIPTDVTFNSDTVNKVYYVFTATESGYIYVTLSVENDSWCDLYLFADGMADGSDSQTSNRETVAKFAVVAGNTYRLGLGTWNISGETTFSITFSTEDIGGSEGGEGGSDVGGEVVEPDGVIYVGEESTVTVTEDHLNAGKLYLSITVWDSGEYSFESNNLFVTAVVAEDGTVVSRNDNWNYELTEWTTYTVEISTAYVSGAGEYQITVEYIYPEGHQYNPHYYTIGEDAVANYAGNYAPYIWYTFYANTTGTFTLATDMDGVYFLISGGYEIESNTLDVMEGRWYCFAVAAFDATEPVDIHFTGTITEGAIADPDGTANLPYTIIIGDNLASVPMWDGVYFMYVADANGVLTLTTANENCSWFITDDLFIENYEQTGDLTMQLWAGDVVYIYVTTVDWNAEDITFNASFVADPTELWYDGSIALDGTANNFYIEENTFLGFQASGMGTYTVTWDADVTVYVDDMPIANGSTVTFTNPYWGPYFKVYFEGYAAGEVAITFTETVAEALPLEIGDNMVLVTDTDMGTTVSLSATETTTYLITVGFETVVVYNYSNYFEGDVFELTVSAGETVELQVCAYYFVSGYYSVNVTVKPEGDVNLDGAQTSATMNFVAPGYMGKADEQSFVAAEAGSYVITADGYENIEKTYLQIYDAASDSWLRIDTNLPYTVELSAGQTLKFRLFGWSNNDAGKEIVVYVNLA